MGRQGGYGGATVEQTRSIDINELRRAGYTGTPPTNWWVHRIKLLRSDIQPQNCNEEAITLDNQVIHITHLPWHYRGQRAYFLCDCGRTVGKLYAPFGYPWRCRHCYGLTYATRQAAPQYRLILKAQKIREQLRGNLGVINAFPDKPKGMHWRRYTRLRLVHDQAVANSLATLTPFFGRVTGDVSEFTRAMQTKGRRRRGRLRS
jgi:hypothetical protein